MKAKFTASVGHLPNAAAVLRDFFEEKQGELRQLMATIKQLSDSAKKLAQEKEQANQLKLKLDQQHEANKQLQQKIKNMEAETQYVDVGCATPLNTRYFC